MAYENPVILHISDGSVARQPVCGAKEATAIISTLFVQFASRELLCAECLHVMAARGVIQPEGVGWGSRER